MEVCASWVAESSAVLADIVKECKILPSGGLDDLLDEDCCLSLSKPHGNEETKECILRLSTRLDAQGGNGSSTTYQIDPRIQRKVLNSVLIVSEARHIEVFNGQHEEYYKTAEGELLAEVEESKLFKSIIAFDKCEESITLKFKNFLDTNSLWIYAIYASTEIITNTNGFDKPTRFSGKHLSSVLDKHSITISDEANKFRNILESFNNDTSRRVGISDKDPLQMMMGTMMGMYSGSRDYFPGAKSLQNNSLLQSSLDYENVPRKEHLDSLFRGNTPSDLATCERRYSISSQSESCSGESTLSDTSLDGEDNIAKSPMTITKTENNVRNKKVYSDEKMEKFMGKMKSFLKEDHNETEKGKLNFLLGLHPSKPLSFVNREQGYESKDKKLDENKLGKLKVLETKLPESNSQESQFSMMKSIESIIDNKMNAMEKRLLRKIDDSFREKQKKDNEHFDRLERMLMQLMEDQMQKKS